MLEKMRKLALPNLKTHLIFWPLIIAGVTADLWSKAAVFDWLMQKPGNSVQVIGNFLRLVIAVNNGAAFGIASGQRYLLSAISLIALVVILAIFLFSGTRKKTIQIAMALFTAGICGNLYDRLFNDGLVRDFIDVVYWPSRHWPAFNIADSMLCIAVGLIIISSAADTGFTGRPDQKHDQQHK